jgi:hypothetical protein
MAPTDDAAPQLLHASPARRVWRRRGEPSEGDVVAKVFVSGARSEAERELAALRLAHGPGVVAAIDVVDDPTSRRPCLRTRHLDGLDLDQVVAAEGALPAAAACALLAPVAETLARLHGLRDAAAPRGLCHGDVKPKNLLRTATTTVLLDFEHARPIAATAVGDGPRGTAGFAAPEAATGGAPTPALDVFGLGRTLDWLLGGGVPGAVPRAPAVAALIADCTAATAAARPSAAEAARRLRELASALPSDPAEATLADWATGRCERPPAGDGAALADGDDRVAAWRRRHRLLQRRPHVLPPATALPTTPAALAAALARNAAALARLPRHTGLLAQRARLAAEVGHRIATAAADVAALQRQDEHDAALAWLDGLDAAARRQLHAPGGLRLPVGDDAGAPAFQTPLDLLRALRLRAVDGKQAVDDACARITDAERRLDLAGTEAAIDALAAERGGASPLVARQRDRLHRFGFYLDRIARALPTLARAGSLQDGAALGPVGAFVTAVRHGGGGGRDDDGGAAVGLRSALATIGSLADEFPHVAGAAPAHAALRAALAGLTDDAWELVAAAKQRLHAVPVPVRPLQLTLGRLDTLRLLEALVDRPDRPRSQLLDQIEALRVALDQARSTRDRLAQSAESAIARGHWTTGLFDMERALARIEPDGDAERGDAERLQERLQAARRRKQEIDAALRRNVELAARCAALLDDPRADGDARAQALADRRDCLLFLTMHAPQDRSELYRRDLRDVDAQLALARAAANAQRLDATRDPGERLRRARATADDLGSALAAGIGDGEAGARLARAHDEWRARLQRCQQDLADADRAAAAAQRRRALALVAAVAVAAAAVATAIWATN